LFDVFDDNIILLDFKCARQLIGSVYLGFAPPNPHRESSPRPCWGTGLRSPRSPMAPNPG